MVVATTTAIDDGKLGSRTALGQEFQRARRENIMLQKRYEAAGSSRAAQNAFKVKWAKEELDAAVKKIKTHTEETAEHESVDAMYRPFGRIVFLQGATFPKHIFPNQKKIPLFYGGKTCVSETSGGNDPPAWKAAVNIAVSCLRDWEQGRLFQGKPFVKFCKRSQRLNFLDIEERAGYSNTQSWSLQTTSASSVSGAGQGEQNDAGGEGDDDPKDPPKPKEVDPKKKALAKCLSTAVGAKREAMLAAQTCSDLMHCIATDEVRSWANNDRTLSQLRSARLRLDDFKGASKFWSQCFLEAQFVPHAKKTFTEHEILQEGARVVELRQHVSAISTEVEKMQRMHKEFVKGS